HRRCKSRAGVSGTCTRCEHGVPAPEGLLPERLEIGQHATFAHFLVTTPSVVHQNIDLTAVMLHLLKKSLGLFIFGMIALDGDTVPTRCTDGFGRPGNGSAQFVGILLLFDRAPRDVNRGPSLPQPDCHTLAHPAAGPRYDCNLPIQYAHHRLLL